MSTYAEFFYSLKQSYIDTCNLAQDKIDSFIAILCRENIPSEAEARRLHQQAIEDEQKIAQHKYHGG